MFVPVPRPRWSAPGTTSRLGEYALRIKCAYIMPSRQAGFRIRVSPMAALFGSLVAANIATWLCAWAAFHDRPVLFGTAFLAWTLGLRHAVDADHIAAIDNVTRKLMQAGRRSLTVGLFFALGHSAVVALAVAALALAAPSLRSWLEGWRETGGLVGTLVSAFLLFAIAIVNLVIFRSTWQSFRRAQGG